MMLVYTKMEHVVIKTVIFLTLISVICSSLAFAQDIILTIDSVNFSINYTVVYPNGGNVTTIEHPFSIDGGSIWMAIDDTAISNNATKPPGSSSIIWDTTVGNNNLSNIDAISVLFRMKVLDVEDAGTWLEKASMPTARRGLTAGVVNGKIYAIGGIDQLERVSTVEEYDPVTNTWTSKASMPTARVSLTAGWRR